MLETLIVFLAVVAGVYLVMLVPFVFLLALLPLMRLVEKLFSGFYYNHLVPACREDIRKLFKR